MVSSSQRKSKLTNSPREPVLGRAHRRTGEACRTIVDFPFRRFPFFRPATRASRKPGALRDKIPQVRGSPKAEPAI